jgi:hypothetical protein
MNITNVINTITLPRIEDWEVKEHWRKEWIPVLDEKSTDIEINDDYTIKQSALALMRRRKTWLMNRVYSTYYDEYTLLVCFDTGGVYYFNNKKYELVIQNNQIYLRDYITGETKLVYDGEFFYPTPKKWLMKSSSRLSRSHRYGIEWGKNGFRADRIFIKDHQLIAVLYFGQEAIYAVEEFHSLVVNHRNLNKHDNRPENLELCTDEENTEHYLTMKPILEAKKLEFTRLVVSTIQQMYGNESQPIVS